MRRVAALKKIYVNPTEGAVVTCEGCGRSRKFTCSSFPPAVTKARVRCTCGVSYDVTIELRKADRRPTHLAGSYTKVDSLTVAGKMAIENLSLYGIGFKTASGHDIKVHDKVKVEFYLDQGIESNIFKIDDQSRTRIVKYVFVRWTQENYVGAEFADASSYADELERFLEQT